MALAPDKAKTLSELAKMGVADITTRGIEFDPPPGNRGLQRGMRVTMWKCSITSLDASKPMIVAIRPDATDAENAAKALFVEMVGRKVGQPFETVSVPPDYTKPGKAAPAQTGPTAKELAAKLAAKQAVEEDDDSDIEDLI